MVKLIGYLIEILFPKKCAVCGKIITDGALCENCLAKIRFIKDKPDNSSDIAAFEYDSVSSKLIYGFKFRGKRYIADVLSEYMAQRFRECFRDRQFSCITYVPMSSISERKRGFNQSKLLAYKLSQKLNIPCEDMLKKVRKNKTQHTLSADERRKNVHGVYAVKDKEMCSGKSILLVDDVFTTGSTVRACRDELLNAGAVYTASLCAAKAIDYEHRRYET